MSVSPNEFNLEIPLGAHESSNGSGASNECRNLVHALKIFSEALRQAVSAFERVDGSQPDTGNFYDLVSAFETDLIRNALRRTNGHQGRAAQMLGLRTTTLNTKIKRLKLSG